MIYGGSSSGFPDVAVVADPVLMSAEPGLMTGAASLLASAGRSVSSVSHAVTGVGHRLQSEWKGKGSQAFSDAVGTVTFNAPLAAESLMGASAALETLARQITAAQDMARQAQTLAAQAASATRSWQQSYAGASAERIRSLPSGASASEVAAAGAPTAAEMSEADYISGMGARASNLMDEANRLARQAWSAAAVSFDEITSSAPSVINADVAARVKVFNKGMESEATMVLFLAEASAAFGPPGGEGEDEAEPELAVDPAEDPLLVEDLGAEERLAVDGEGLGPGVAADLEGGVKVGWSSSVEIDMAFQQLLTDPAVAPMLEGADPYGGTTPGEYQNGNWDAGAKSAYGTGNWKYPPNGGADLSQGVDQNYQMPPGTRVDRFGPPSGAFVSPEGTPWQERALPTSLLPLSDGTSSYHDYVTTDKWSTDPPPVRVVESAVAPAFNQPGGGIQYQFVDSATGKDVSVGWLVHNGYLEPGG